MILEYSMAPIPKKIARLAFSFSLNSSLLLPPLFNKAQIMESLGPCLKSYCGWHCPEKNIIKNLGKVLLNYIYNTFLNAPRQLSIFYFLNNFSKQRSVFYETVNLSINS